MYKIEKTFIKSNFKNNALWFFRLSGLSPFMGDNDAETFANITRADFDFDDDAFDAISQDAKDFISGLLVKRKEWVIYF